MSNKVKSRSGAGTPKREGKESHWTSGNPYFNYKRSDAEGQEVISQLLSHGSGNGLGLKDLVRLTGLSEREVRRQIHEERRRGIPILSDNQSGYFLPLSESEKVACVRSLRHRAAEIMKVAAAIEKSR